MLKTHVAAACLLAAIALPQLAAQWPSMRLLTPGTGWITTANHLLWTNSAGLSWSDITPYSTGEASLHSVFFLDTMHGWVLRSVAASQLELARTSDGGITWSVTSFPLTPEQLNTYGGRAALDFIDPSHGWAILRLVANSNFSMGMLFSTSDGGATWSALPDPPLGDPVRFISSTDGWLAGGPRGDQLFVTRDAGHTWLPQNLARPAGVPSSAQARYSLPVFENPQDGSLPASYQWSAYNVVALYQTRDGGRTWQLTTHHSAAASPGISIVDSHLILVSPGGNGAITTATDGQPRSTGDRTIPAQVNVIAVDFASLSQGWILTAEGHCQGYKTGCTQQQTLLATSDGGATYRDVSPALLSQPEKNAAVDGSGEGFDLCSPTTSDLQAWYSSSPYRYVNVYIGGVNAACPQPGLNSSWVSQVMGQGWGLIPTWVGLQAPCSSCTGCSAFSSNTSTAASQGTSEAQSAAAEMSSIGLSGSVVYYDLEQYNATSSCSAAASAFVNAWVQELHTLGYTAGVYGSPTNANSDWLNISNSPDAVWLALWNGVASVWNLSPVPNTVWANHQRIHQYSGGVNQTYGGVTLNVDQDYLDGPVAGSIASGFSMSASPSSLTIAAGASGTSTITTTISGSFNSSISLTASGLPSGVTAGFNPSSIAAPGSGSSTLTISAGSSTAAGTYTVTVTGTGGGVTNTAAISLTITTSGGGGGTQLIVDGGFESATASGLSAPGWTATTNISGHTVIIYHGAYPHTGSNYAYEGAYNNQNDTLTQTVTIPSNATSASLTFWVNIVTQETNTTTPYDFLYVEIHNTSGGLLSTPLTLNDLNSTSSNNTNGVYFQPAAVNLLSYAGQTIEIVFHATTDVGKPTTFRIDDVSLLVNTSGGTPSFSISASPSSVTVAAGASGTSTVSTTVSGGFNSAISLTASGMPSGVTASFNPSSIAAPGSGSSTLTLSASSSTAAGTYTVTVTGSGGGITNSTSVSLTVTTSGGGGSQLIVDGGFESATASGLSAPGWTATTNISGHAVIVYHGSYPHSGGNYAYEGAYNNDNDTLTQTVTVPSNTTAASLTFWVNVVTQETTTTTPYDFLYVEIHNTNGALLTTPLTLSNLNSTSSSNTNGVYFQPASINLAPYIGETIEIVFHSTTDVSNPTTFRIDDVSLQVTTAGTQLITDGGFESATATGLTAPGWTATTNISGHSIIIYHLSYPHTGSNYAYEGAYNNDNDTLTQTVTIPAGISSAMLTFWVNVVTQETTTTTAYDYLYVEIHNSSGVLLSTPMTLSNLNSPSSNNTNGVYYQPAAINLAAYAGQTIQIVFHVTTNGSNVTTFRLDDISLLAM